MVVLVSLPVPVEGIQYTEPNVTANVNGNEVGTGTLYITESEVLWLNAKDEGIGLEYKHIILHAICRDQQAFPREHLLCHYDGKLPGVNEGDEANEDDIENGQDAESDYGLVEIIFAPEIKESLQAMYDALADCQALHPDSDCQLSEDEFEDADNDEGSAVIYDSEEGLGHLTEQGRANLDRLNTFLDAGQGDADITAQANQLSLSNGYHNDPQMDADQFQDADDMNE